MTTTHSNDTIGTNVRHHATRRAALAAFSAAIGLALAALGFGQSTVGSPLGFGDTVTTGAISALALAVPIAIERDHPAVLNASQADAALNGVNSAMAEPGGIGQIRRGTALQRGAEPTTELIVCVRRVCNPKE